MGTGLGFFVKGRERKRVLKRKEEERGGFYYKLLGVSN